MRIGRTACRRRLRPDPVALDAAPTSPRSIDTGQHLTWLDLPMVCTCEVLNQDATVVFIVALMKNAQNLLSDAQVLLSHDRHARAFVLSVLAREEAGKALLVLAQEMGDTAIQGRQLTNHREKLLSASAAELVLLGELDQLTEAARGAKDDRTHDEKLAGLYVDWNGGSLRTPACIEPKRAVEAYEGAASLLGSLDSILGQLTPEALRVAQLLDQQLGPVLSAYGEAVDLVAGVGLAREMIAWGASQTGEGPSSQRAPATRKGED